MALYRNRSLLIGRIIICPVQSKALGWDRMGWMAMRMISQAFICRRSDSGVCLDPSLSDPRIINSVGSPSVKSSPVSHFCQCNQPHLCDTGTSIPRASSAANDKVLKAIFVSFPPSTVYQSLWPLLAVRGPCGLLSDGMAMQWKRVLVLCVS